MPVRHCVCGKVITIDSALCNECVKEYGVDRSKWDLWVVYLVSDEEHELNRDRKHREVAYSEECTSAALSDVAAHNLKRARLHPEMSFEEFNWSNQ